MKMSRYHRRRVTHAGADCGLLCVYSTCVTWLGECLGMKPVMALFLRTPVLTRVLDTVRCVLFSLILEDAEVEEEDGPLVEGLTFPPPPMAPPTPICPLPLITDSLRVFFTLTLLDSRSSVNSPVFLSIMSTHSFVYFFWLPLNTVLGTPEPSKCGTVTCTWLLVPTSTVASLLRSTLAGLKSSEMAGEGVNGNGLLLHLDLTFERMEGVVMAGEGTAQFKLPTLRRIKAHAILHPGQLRDFISRNCHVCNESISLVSSSRSHVWRMPMCGEGGGLLILTT